MRQLKSTLHGKDATWPTRDGHLPPAPKEYCWEKQSKGGISSGNWRYLDDKDGNVTIWAVRNVSGDLCMGVMNHEGYVIEPEDYDTVVAVLLTKKRLGLTKKT